MWMITFNSSVDHSEQMIIFTLNAAVGTASLTTFHYNAKNIQPHSMNDDFLLYTNVVTLTLLGTVTLYTIWHAPSVPVYCISVTSGQPRLEFKYPRD